MTEGVQTNKRVQQTRLQISWSFPKWLKKTEVFWSKFLRLHLLLWVPLKGTVQLLFCTLTAVQLSRMAHLQQLGFNKYLGWEKIELCLHYSIWTAKFDFSLCMLRYSRQKWLSAYFTDLVRRQYAIRHFTSQIYLPGLSDACQIVGSQLWPNTSVMNMLHAA